MASIPKLLDNVSTTAGVDITGDWVIWFGGPGDFWVRGDLGGGTVYLEAGFSGSASTRVCDVAISGTSATQAGVTKFNFNHGTKIRAVLADVAHTATGVFCEVN